jgi:hypothetical protein
VRGSYIPFGIFSDDKDVDNFMVEEVKLGGSPDLLGDRPTPLKLASEQSYKNGLPSRLTLDPDFLPTCYLPNSVFVTLRRLETRHIPTLNHKALQKKLMVLSTPPTDESNPIPMLNGGYEILTLGELLHQTGINLSTLMEVQNDFKKEPLRIGVLAVAVEHRDQIIAKLKLPGPSLKGAYGGF